MRFALKPPNFLPEPSTRLAEIPALQGRAFDLVVCFQALGLLYNPGIFCAMRKLQPLGGRLVFTGAHPFRYVAMRMEMESIPPGIAYRDESPFSYPAPWDPSVNNTGAKPMISTVINLLLGGGYRLERMTEWRRAEE